jgi:hypothetical protein
MAFLAGKRQKMFAEEVMFASDEAGQKKLQRAAKQGALTRIMKGIYVNAVAPADLAPDVVSPVDLVVRRNWQKILGHILPGAVVSHLSALRGGITPDGEITLSHPTRFNTSIHLPGLTAVLMKGPSALPGDMPLWNTGLYWSSRPRMLLENLAKSRSSRPRTAGKTGVEDKLVAILNASGETALNRLRDDARKLAEPLEASKEFNTLNDLAGALLGTYARGVLTTPAGVLVAKGTPADAELLGRLSLLADHLRITPLPDFLDVAQEDPARTHFAFLESYFSNYVEGTKFSIEEAEGIALRNEIVPNRPKDSHDVLGVFKLVLHPHFRSSIPPPNEILDGLCERHRIMLERRPEITPGEFKTKMNYAGQTKFVDPVFVRGTLQEGAKLATSVPEGLARAIFYAFLVSDIHPFNDGNGRVARLLMNSELSRLGRCRILIPTLFHEQYVDAQRALTRNNDPVPLVRAMHRVAEWTTLFEYQDLKQVVLEMTKAHAFEEDPKDFKLLDRNG